MASINLTSSVHEHHNPGVVLPVNARTPGRSLQTVSQMRHAFAEPEGHGRTGHDGPRNWTHEDTGGTGGTHGDTTYVGFGTVRRKEAVVLTAKLTAILSDIGNRQRTSAESGRSISIWGGRRRTAADVRNAVFKTVGGRP